MSQVPETFGREFPIKDVLIKVIKGVEGMIDMLGNGCERGVHPKIKIKTNKSLNLWVKRTIYTY